MDNPDMFLSAMQGMDRPVSGTFATLHHLAASGQRLSTGGQLFDSSVRLREADAMGTKPSTGILTPLITHIIDLK